MIQELLGGGASFIASGERKLSINGGGGVLVPPSPSPNTSLSSSPSPSSTATSTAAAAAAAAAANSSNSESQNLRCPRCDSSNTKFCYYNNYNLTQPRHFCKTCRRYWTKGGALRNVPIGGGCRKNKNVGVSNSAAKSSATKMKAVASEVGRSALGHGFDHEIPASPILWGSPQNTPLLALLRANQTQNPNPNPSPLSINAPITIKEEGGLMGSQSQMVNTEPLIANGMLNIPRTLGLGLGYDCVGQVPSLGLCSSVWRNNQDQSQQQNSNGFVHGEHHQSSGIQELYHKLRSSSTSSANYCGDNISLSPMFLGNMASSSSSILESSSIAGSGELGCWNNPTLPWGDLPTTNGAYP